MIVKVTWQRSFANACINDRERRNIGMAITWTKQQRQVIDLRGRNLLVSAAAGSGKTAVLVERIIKKVLDPEHPVDIDHLLVVTFNSSSSIRLVASHVR